MAEQEETVVRVLRVVPDPLRGVEVPEATDHLQLTEPAETERQVRSGSGFLPLYIIQRDH